MADRYKVVINHEEQYSIWPAERGKKDATARPSTPNNS